MLYNYQNTIPAADISSFGDEFVCLQVEKSSDILFCTDDHNQSEDKAEDEEGTIKGISPLLDMYCCNQLIKIGQKFLISRMRLEV